MQAAAACDTVNVCEAIVKVPVRGEAFGLAATLKPADPLPLPLPPLVTVIHDYRWWSQTTGSRTARSRLSNPRPRRRSPRGCSKRIENVHPTPAWVTVTVWPATVSVPTRCVALPFAVALNTTEPLPVPLAPLVTDSQPVLLLTPVQAQPVGDVTVAEPLEQTRGNGRRSRATR